MSTVAVLDSGINEEYIRSFLNDNTVTFYNISEEKDSFKIDKGCPYDKYGHGTECVSIINRHCPDVNYVILPLLDRNGFCDMQKLVCALKFFTKIDVDFSNLSLSSVSTYLYKELCDTIDLLAQQNKFVIAAKSNDMDESYPACLGNVYGVEGIGWNSKEYFEYCEEASIQLRADNTPSMMPELKGVPAFFGGNSKATAVITGVLARAFSKKSITAERINSFLSSPQSIKPQNDVQRTVIDRNEIDKVLAKRKIAWETISKGECEEQCYYQLIEIASRVFCMNLSPEMFDFADFASEEVFFNAIENADGLLT